MGVAESVDVAEALQREGFAVLRRLVPQEAIDIALRHLHADVLTRGLPQEWISEWQWVSKNWFPHLRWDPEIVQVSEYLPESLRDGWPCEPQILLAFPDTGDPWELTPHVDAPPEWAVGKGYHSICGVALTPSNERNGGLVVWPFNDGRRPYQANLDPGDVIVMHPLLPHTAGFNATAEIRYALYFRYVERDVSTSAEQPKINAS